MSLNEYQKSLIQHQEEVERLSSYTETFNLIQSELIYPPSINSELNFQPLSNGKFIC